MPILKLQFPDGSEEDRPLTRAQPVAVGRQSFNDICVAEDGVGAMHCRFGWNKTAFEVTAATSAGVDVNGTAVTRAVLRPGDIVRVGSLDLVFIDTASEAAPVAPPPPPVSQARLDDSDSKSSRVHKRPIQAPPPPVSPATKVVPPVPPSKPVEDMSLFEGPVYTQSQEIPIASLDDDDSSTTRLSRTATSAKIPNPASKPARGLLSVPTGRRRPGEEDIFSSPLVLGLSIGGVVLLLLTGIFWFLMAREQAARLYDQAQGELANGQAAQAVTSFETFVKKYPRHALRRLVDRGLDQALVERETKGASPAWKRGLEQLQKMISNHRAESDFADLHPILFKLSGEISLGAAQSAETTRDAELLIVSDEARSLMERYADPTVPPSATLTRIREAKNAAEKAIGKQNTFDSAMEAVETALADKKPIVAMIERERLVRRFPDYASHKRVKASLQKALDLERSVISIDETERPAETTDDNPPTADPTLGLFHTRSRTDEASGGRVAYVLAKDSCFAIDTVTGEFVWRRIVGLNPPFFPILAAEAQPCLLVCDAQHNTLDCVHPLTGKLQWRQKLTGRPRCAPLVNEGQIYLATDDRSLSRIDLDSGRMSARVLFSQNVLGPPAISHDGSHMLVPGDMGMIYSLTLRPLAAAAMTFTDHAAGAISAPPLSLGKLLLLCENDKSDSARLRLFDASKPTDPLNELAGARVKGTVRDTPVLRGNQLVVPSSQEQLAAFSVTDETGREGLAPVAEYRVQEGYGGLMFVALGADRQFWAASSAFRRFEVGADSIRMDQNAVAPGIASQPLQLIGDQFYVGRKAPYHDAVVFSGVDRDRMLSPWRIVLGAEPLEMTSTREGGIVSVNEAGQIVMLGAARLKSGGVELRAASELEVPSTTNLPLRGARLHDGRLLLAANSESPVIWIVGDSGQIASTLKLAKGDIIEADPVLIDDGLVVPLSGRLKCLPLAAGMKTPQDWLAPVEENAKHRWKFLTRLDANQLIGCDDRGLLTRIQVRTTDLPHLAAATKLQLDHPVDIPPTLRDDTLFVAQADGSVKQLNARTFDVDGSRSFPSPVRGVWAVGQKLFVWSGDDKLHAVEPGKQLPDQWVFDLKGHQPAGGPVEWNGSIWLACRDGLVIAINSTTGKESHREQLPQFLSLGLRMVAADLMAVACDGTVYRLGPGGKP